MLAEQDPAAARMVRGVALAATRDLVTRLNAAARATHQPAVARDAAREAASASEIGWRLYLDRGFSISKSERQTWQKLGFRAPPDIERFGKLDLSPQEIMAWVKASFEEDLEDHS